MLFPLVKFVHSYIRDSNDIIRQLRNISPVIPGYKIFTTDATAMYPNIDTELGLLTIEKYLKYFGHEHDQNLPITAIMDFLRLVMKNCTFKFGDSWWKQCTGTAMGTPCACIYAILFFAYYERTIILRKYKRNIIFYRRQIDDIFCVWKDTTEHPNT